MSSLQERAANVALYSFEPAQLDPDVFQVVRFEGTEGLSQLFSFELQLVSESPDIDFSKVVNRSATFTMMRGDVDLPINGIVTSFSQRGRSANYVSYRATLRPRLHRLSLNRRSRIFQEMSVEDILRSVLKEAGFSATDFRFALQASYSRREYCVQYRESDLHFINRLMEAEGMYYFFDHKDGQDVLVVTDQKSEHGKIAAPATVRYHDGAGGMVDQEQETVERFLCEEQVVPGTVQMTDYNYRTPETMTVRSEINGDMPGLHAEYGEHFRDAEQGNRLATVRNEEIEARRRVMTGKSDSIGFRSGFLFTLEKHFRPDLNADYLLTEITHEGSQRGGLDIDARHPSQSGRTNGEVGLPPEPGYRNRFTCIPAPVQYRPPRETEKPEVPGVVTATVESAGGEYAYIDDQGRYRAKMHFDHRDDRSDGTRTLPIRMSQPYSGADYGMHFPNHADTELLIAFENGDIDRPIALGTTPNPSNKSPSVSSNKMENILRSFGGNELLMDDTKGETQVKLNSANAHRLLFDDKNEKIELLSTDSHRILLDDKKKRIEVQSKKGRKIVLDDDNEVMSVVSAKGHYLHVSDENDNVTVSDADGKHVLTLDYENEKMSLMTEGDIGFEAEGALEMKSKSLSIETEEGAEMTVGGDLTQNADGSMTVEAQGDLTAEAGQALDLSGVDVTVEGAKSFAANGGTTAELTGAQLTVEGSGIADIKGGTLKANG